ncbi:MAG TPA: ABC transporter permease [Rubrivivax sp.]|nr:ABC transporter permease [Rubrivivax sp.]
MSQVPPLQPRLREDAAPQRADEAAPQPGRHAFVEFWVRLVREKPLGAVGGALCLLMLLVALTADLIAPQGYNAIDPLRRLQPPSAEAWFGTDQLGRDLFARIVHGARLSVVVAFAAASLSIVISALIGIVSGYLGGRVDMAMQRVVDSWMIFPDLVFLLLLVSVAGPGTGTVIFSLALVFGVTGSRIVRAQVLSVKENAYVKAAQSIGASTRRILLTHILPNVLPILVVLFALRLGAVILYEATLSFIGMGIPPPQPAWGGMLNVEGRTFMFRAPWLTIFPSAALVILVFGINMFGDAVRDLIDPRMRGSGGRYGGRVRRRKGSK